MGSARDHFLSEIRPLHQKLRKQKVDIFLKLVGGRASRLLDVGGAPGIAGEFLDLYRCFESVVVVNLAEQRMESASHPSFQIIIANGCNLPFPSHSFDWVFSNAVIEHVGDWDKQLQFANEIRRVSARGYLVTTPNKHFPIEPHTLLPFYQFLTPNQQRRIVRFSPGYMRERLEINLLSHRDLGRLFPEARILKMGLPLFPNSLAAMYSTEKQDAGYA